VKDGMLDLAGEGLRERISNDLDLDIIREKFESRQLSVEGWLEIFEKGFDLVMTIQAPSRDKETKQKHEEVKNNLASEPLHIAVVKSLELLLDRVNIMRVDAANHRLKLIAPVVQEHGVGYFRDKFELKLKNGIITLDKTKVNLFPFNLFPSHKICDRTGSPVS
jgi:T-complex protein 11